MLPQPPLLEVRDLNVAYPGRRGLWSRSAASSVLQDVSFSLACRERLAIVGESGSGKTTLLRAVLRMLVPTQGQVLLEGTDLAILSRRELRERRRCVQMVFQDPQGSLNPTMTVQAIVAEPVQAARAEVIAALQAVGLPLEILARRPRQLSGGQAQRVAIARALIAQPQLLICDEPVSALDMSLRAQVLQLLAAQSQQRGLALLVVTHDLAAARYLCDRVLVLQQGRVVEAGSAQSVFSAPQHPYTRQLLAAVLSTRSAGRGNVSSS